MQPAATAVVGARWSEPPISGRFEPAIGSSIVEQIVIGHTPADVLRELVQNEFDAHGHRMRVTFGPDHLNVTGGGKPVDKTGWERLSVILGTGVVIGSTADAREVRPKENGIGSKNLGLRTLFLFGDRIYLRSSGKMAVLDLKRSGLSLTPTRPVVVGRVCRSRFHTEQIGSGSWSHLRSSANRSRST